MRVEALGLRKIGKREFGQREGPVQESAGAGRIHHETRGDIDIASVALTVQSHFIAGFDGALQIDLVEILGAGDLCLADEVLVNRRPIPARIGNGVVRARRHQQLIFTVATGGGAPVELVVIESEAVLESAVHIRIGVLPCVPFCERRNAGKIVSFR